MSGAGGLQDSHQPGLQHSHEEGNFKSNQIKSKALFSSSSQYKHQSLWRTLDIVELIARDIISMRPKGSVRDRMKRMDIAQPGIELADSVFQPGSPKPYPNIHPGCHVMMKIKF